MKKVLFKTFLLLSIIVFSSCSGNDEETNPDSSFKNEIKMTINGREVTFNQVVVGENDYHLFETMGGAIKLTGTIDNSTNEVISISILKDKVGTDSLAEIEYIKDGERYHYNTWLPTWVTDATTCTDNPSNIVFVTATNDGSSASGSFTGILSKCNKENGNETLVDSFDISEATFNVKY